MQEKPAKCAVCGGNYPRDKLTLYTMPNEAKLVCENCLDNLPPEAKKAQSEPKKKEHLEDVPIGARRKKEL